jgi:DNA mismatch endonuclease (patch repair protein)
LDRTSRLPEPDAADIAAQPPEQTAETVPVRAIDLPEFERPSQSRSRNMAAMRGKDTRPELIVRRALHRAGFRYRVHPTHLPGRPDLVLPRYRVAVLVHGCFWHGHDCARAKVPASNRDYWLTKLKYNRQRDERAIASLYAEGWRVVVIWQCELQTSVQRLIEELSAQRSAASALG